MICEAFSAGRVVLASDISDNRLLLGSNGERGFLFDPQDAQSLARVIVKILDLDLSSLIQKGEHAREFIEKELSIEKMTLAYIDLWTEKTPETEMPTRCSYWKRGKRYGHTRALPRNPVSLKAGKTASQTVF